MRRICWPAWISAVSMVAFVLLASGCQSSEPLVPREIYQQVNDDGREWTYDTAWQNIRALNADLEAGDVSTIPTQSLFIASQMERLEKGKAGSMSSYSNAHRLEAEAHEASKQSAMSKLEELQQRGQALQESFDAGDFASAKNHALAAHALALSF
ncbi:MAG: hypothetical protein O3B98_05315 [Actinobacteria bacterium]|nr:hypothetical protein [Actinomycetota bacterium]